MAAFMNLASIALDRFKRWVDAPDDGAGVDVFRRVLAAIWLVYDIIDVTWGMTERSRVWFPHPRTPGLVVVQLVLIASCAVLLTGRAVWVSGMIATGARAFEAMFYFPLNDFFFASVMYLLLAHSKGGPFARGQRPKWVRDTLIAQLGFIYLATGLLKLNPDWLSGGHLFVRTQYLARSHGWPYPLVFENALSSLAVDKWLATIGAAAELTLGAILLLRGPYWIAAMLSVSIHAFGAVTTNVWFFSASMVAGVLLLVPRAPGVAATLNDDGASGTKVASG